VLSDFLTINIFHMVLIVVRVGVLFTLAPGFSASYVSMRIKVILAVAIAFIALPAISPFLPDVAPSAPAVMVLLLVKEAAIGVFFAALAQGLFFALHLAGTSIGFSSGLMNAMVFDPVVNQQAAMVVGILNNIALLLLFTTGLHYLMLEAVLDSYTLFPVTQSLDIGGLADNLAQTITRSFHIGGRIAAPFLVFMLTFQVGMGLIARLMPQMNVFFVALPLQVMLGLGLLMIALPAIVLLFMGYFEQGFRSLSAL
jgi:flagellar biosynthetic protein FliR